MPPTAMPPFIAMPRHADAIRHYYVIFITATLLLAFHAMPYAADADAAFADAIPDIATIRCLSLP